jgi:hypothetical protein
MLLTGSFEALMYDALTNRHRISGVGKWQCGNGTWQK